MKILHINPKSRFTGENVLDKNPLIIKLITKKI